MGLELDSIEHRYDGAPAVDGAALDVADGEIVCLFGPSGCGKTTLLRLAAGLERIQRGAVRLDGKILSDAATHVAPERRQVGFVFQDYVLFPHLTVQENVAFGLSDLPRAECRLRTAQELSAAGLGGFESRWPHQLSGGQQQRVALARAMARRPKAMLLDEPFAGIDAALRRRLRSDVRRVLKRAGAATLLVTHDADEALALGDRIAIMRAGKILQIGSPRTLFEHPAFAESAMLFAGVQSFEGVAEHGIVRTALGDFDAGPATGAAMVVAMPGSTEFVQSQAGRLKVIESRFAGPGWRVEARLNDVSVFAGSPVAIPQGAAVDVRFAPGGLRVFSANKN